MPCLRMLRHSATFCSHMVPSIHFHVKLAQAGVVMPFCGKVANRDAPGFQASDCDLVVSCDP